MKRVAVFASGTGSNALNLISYFKESSSVEIAVLYCDNPRAGILNKLKGEDITIRNISRKQVSIDGMYLLNLLKEDGVDYILLAGYLSLIPAVVTQEYIFRILNIHPALLPKYGGMGMYGDRVHSAILANGEIESGITIHYVNENYDEGDILFQSKFEIPANSDMEFVKRNISIQEQKYYPIVAETAMLLIGV